MNEPGMHAIHLPLEHRFVGELLLHGIVTVLYVCNYTQPDSKHV